MSDQHIPQLTCEPDSENEFSIEHVWYIDLYEDGDWSGTLGHPTKFYSDTPDTQVELVAPVTIDPIIVLNSYWKDINNTGEIIDATDPSNTVINCDGILGPTVSNSILVLIYDG